MLICTGSHNSSRTVRELLRLNPWARPYVTIGQLRQCNEFSHARMAACLDRARRGDREWNRWATDCAAVLNAARGAGESAEAITLCEALCATMLLSSDVASYAGFLFPAAVEAAGLASQSEAYFNGARFLGPARFTGATFSIAGVWFEGARFGSIANFDGAVFTGAAEFRQAQFEHAFHMRGARFNRDAWFVGAIFEAAVFADNAQFAGEAGFGSCKFSGPVEFCSACFRAGAGFEGSRFEDEANFDDVDFKGPVWLRDAAFQKPPSFHRARFADMRRVLAGGARFPVIESPVSNRLERLARSLRSS